MHLRTRLLACAVAVETARRITMHSMEGEGSAIVTYTLNTVLGFPLSLLTNPLLEFVNPVLDGFPRRLVYSVWLLLTVLNWVLLGFLAERLINRRNAARDKSN